MSFTERNAVTQLPSRDEANADSRQLFIDNLRWIVIVLVLSMHAADTYSPLGSWYYVDRRPIDHSTFVFFAAWQIYLQAFFMGVLFFIAGFFVPLSFDRKGPWRFLRDRFFRLGLPVLLYMLIIGPVTEYFVAHSWTSTVPTSFAHEWMKHIENGEVLQESGPLWFCVALLIFSVAYTLIRAVADGNSLSKSVSDHFPSMLKILCFVLLMAIATFVVRLAEPPSAFNLPIRDFSQYVLLFSVGILAARGSWLTKLDARAGTSAIILALTVGFMAWFAILSSGGFFRGNDSTLSGGPHWQSAAFAIWESATCVAMSYGLLAILRARFNQQGRAAKFMSANAFSVYVFHPPILILAARMLRGFAWPSVLLFLALTTVAVIASFILSVILFRRIPLLERIL